jgi:hypothetical protein
MSIQFDNPSRISLMENIFIKENAFAKEVKETADCAALGEFFYDATCTIGVATLGSLFFLDRHVTLLCGGLTMISILANKYFDKKVKCNVLIIELLGSQAKELKKLVEIQQEKKSTDQTLSSAPTTSASIERDTSLNDLTTQPKYQ